MTVYSQHPQRGKIQVLATYRSAAGYVSSTVTSLDETMPAAAIVDALNRVSACATVPLSVWDRRGDRFAYYPSTHVAALSDPEMRPYQSSEQHSLWYGCAMHLLGHALDDLDKIVATLPPPVRKATIAELESEGRDLPAHRDAPGNRVRRDDAILIWNDDQPLVVLDEWTDLLSEEHRDKLNNLEKAMSKEELATAIMDLGVLIGASLGTGNRDISTGGLPEYLVISHDWEGEETDYYYLDVDAQLDGHPWRVSIGKWRTTAQDAQGRSRSQTGDRILTCELANRPAVADLVNLFNLSGAHIEQLATWAVTPVEKPLVGTKFVVTERDES